MICWVDNKHVNDSINVMHAIFEHQGVCSHFDYVASQTTMCKIKDVRIYLVADKYVETS